MTKEDTLIVLAAGRPHRGSKPSLLRAPGIEGRVMDWVLRAFGVNNVKPHLMLGYHSKEISEFYPDIPHTVNSDWNKMKSAGTFLLSPFDQRENCYATYSDILFRKSTIDSLRQSKKPISIVVDSFWRQRYKGRSEADFQRCEKVIVKNGKAKKLGVNLDIETANSEFVGVSRFSGKAIEMIKRIQSEKQNSLKIRNLSGLIDILISRGLEVEAIDVEGDWAELNNPEDVARFILGTKAKTLSRLRSLLSLSQIEEVFMFNLEEWTTNSKIIIDSIIKKYQGCKVVVRSSALTEDGFDSTNAGAFTSVLDVDSDNSKSLKTAVEEVIKSYTTDNPRHQVLVQKMVSGVVASGVVFTRNLTYGSPYRVINYEKSSNTDSITSGSSSKHKTLIIHRSETVPPATDSHLLSPLLVAIEEIENLLGIDFLDIEFAISQSNKIHILQVRPITVLHETSGVKDLEIHEVIKSSKKAFTNWKNTSDSVLGMKNVFGVMPDWNPAEIIGTNPGSLATSIYKFLIMDDTWAKQRFQYGYKDIRPEPLLVEFAGHPYVNVRASFSSFIPTTIPNNIANRLVDFYIEWLLQHQHLHDKVEFEVVPTCLGMDFDRWSERLRNVGGFKSKEIDSLENGLLEITKSAFERNDKDLLSIEKLKRRFSKHIISGDKTLATGLSLLDDCRRFGTLPFSHLARSAFVAVTLLRSAVIKGIISDDEKDAFLNSIRTVTQMLTDDALSVSKGKLSWESFIRRYGHLRPGTYDITSPCYSDNPERFLRPIVENIKSHKFNSSEWTNDSLIRLSNGMKNIGLNYEPSEIDYFLRSSIEGREYSKFVFTRNLNEFLIILRKFGEENDISDTELSEIDLEVFKKLSAGKDRITNINSYLKDIYIRNYNLRNITKMVELPPLLYDKEQFHKFFYPSNQPNFVGSDKVTADCMSLVNQTTQNKLELQDRIIAIPQADPGYDWIFGHKIAGLVTKYGGANSHMAIRSAEFGLPAAIGVGPTIFSEVNNAKVILLDCGNQRLEVVR